MQSYGCSGENLLIGLSWHISTVGRMDLHFDSTSGSGRYSVARSGDVGKSTGKRNKSRLRNESANMGRENRIHVYATVVVSR